MSVNSKLAYINDQIKNIVLDADTKSLIDSEIKVLFTRDADQLNYVRAELANNIIYRTEDLCTAVDRTHTEDEYEDVDCIINSLLAADSEAANDYAFYRLAEETEKLA